MERKLSDQASNLRRKAWEKGRKAKYISVSSGKGGVGKTTFTINLACMLAQLGKKVLVLDADLGLANIDIMLKIPPGVNIRMYIEDRASIQDVLIKNVHGFDLLPASSGVVEMAELSEENFNKIKEIFVALDSAYEFVLFDTGAGISSNVHRFASLADYVIVLSQPEPSAIADAYAFIKTVRQQYPPKEFYFVFNRVEDQKSALKIYENLNTVVKRFLQVDLKLLGSVGEDKEMRKSALGQKPIALLYPNSSVAADMREIVQHEIFR